jgi:hypothetical protein
MQVLKSFFENIEELKQVNCAISDYFVEFTLNNLNSDEKFRNIQLNVMLPVFTSYRVDSEKYYLEGKIKKLQKIYNEIEKEASGNILLEQYVLEKTGIKLEMSERYFRKLYNIVQRGKIKNDNEYQMICDQINILCQMKEKEEKLITDLNLLILDFEKIKR